MLTSLNFTKLDMISEFKWDKFRRKAATMVADGKHTDQQIAEAVGVSRQTIDAWRKVPEFKLRVQEDVEKFRTSVMTTGIADKNNRLEALNDRWNRMQELLRIRAGETPSDVLGGETGLLVRREKETKFGTNVEFEVDTGLLAEMRNTEKQAAQELGQWVEKGEISGPNGNPIAITTEQLRNMDTADLARAVAEKVGHS